MEGEPRAAGGGFLAAEPGPERRLIDEPDFGLGIATGVLAHVGTANAVEHALETGEVALEGLELLADEGDHGRENSFRRAEDAT